MARVDVSSLAMSGRCSVAGVESSKHGRCSVACVRVIAVRADGPGWRSREPALLVLSWSVALCETRGRWRACRLRKKRGSDGVRGNRVVDGSMWSIAHGEGVSFLVCSEMEASVPSHDWRGARWLGDDVAGTSFEQRANFELHLINRSRGT